MLMHNKRLQYTVRVSEPNPVLDIAAESRAKLVHERLIDITGADVGAGPGAGATTPLSQRSRPR